MTGAVQLREVLDADLPIFFEQQLDPAANYMAAFTAKNPADRAAFDAHWARIRTDARIILRTILFDGQVAGYVGTYEQAGEPQVTYWLGQQYWGRGLATLALSRFLASHTRRPLFASAAKDNAASIRVLQKCGFALVGEVRSFANARGDEIDEVILKLDESTVTASGATPQR
jgi:RimJ/RimL family protein N-acetyltransferase